MTNTVPAFYAHKHLYQIIKDHPISHILDVKALNKETDPSLGSGTEFQLKLWIGHNIMCTRVIVWDYCVSYHLLNAYMFNPMMVNLQLVLPQLRADLCSMWVGANIDDDQTLPTDAMFGPKTIKEWTDMFIQINKDCDPEEYVAITAENVEYYAEQLHHYGEDFDTPPTEEQCLVAARSILSTSLTSSKK